MFKTRKSKDMAKRIAALTLAFLMVFQYTASGLSIYAWAETDEETQQEEQLEKGSEVTEETGPEEEVKEEDKKEPSKPSDASEPEKEPEKKDEQKKDDKKVEYSATSFDELVSGVTVRIDAPEGALPEGATVVIEAKSLKAAKKVIADTTGDDVKVVKALDISFRDAEGEEIEPHEKVAVNFECGKFEDIRSPVVYHITDEGVAEKLEENTVAVYGDQVSINSKEFSEYVIGEDQNATEEAEEPTRAGETDSNAETWTVTFYNRDAEVYRTVNVVKGEAIGEQLPATIAREDYNAYWAIGELIDGGQGQVIHVTGDRIDSTFTPTEDTVIVPDYDQIKHTITFYEEDKTTVVATKTVTSNTSYCLNDIPAVPTKEGHVGQWVYQDGEDVKPFTNRVAVSADTDVWPDYSKNVFTVTYMVGEATYETDTYYTGDSLTLPTDPVVEGKDFTGWYYGETKINGGESVTSDMTITAKFDDEFFVNFVVLGDDGDEVERLSQYFRSEGETIGTMPQDPFIAGKVFEKWVIKGTDTEVTADTVVTGNMTVEAKFRAIDVYTITAKYYYESTATPGKKVVFNTDIHQIETHELPYTITAPATTQTDSSEVSGAPIYYPENPTVEIKASDFDNDHNCTVEIKYVPYTAEYDFVYLLKDLTGSGYTEIERTHEYGVLNSYVTPSVKQYDYAVLESAQGDTIRQAEGQELEVKYTRKNFQLTYETNGGSYVAASTVPYGSSVELPATNPTRDGYNFEGWYSDQALTQRVTGSVTVNGNTTLYAKWTGKTVNYTIVYMLEEYDNATGTTSYVYDNSRTASGQVGTTVYASSAPDLTGNNYRGYERDEAFDQTSKITIAADGSSVLVVHYNLIRYTLVFNINRNDGRITIGGRTYTGSNYRIENVVLGQDVSSMWPATQDEIYDRYDNRYFDGWTGAGSTYITKRYELIYANVANANSNHVMTYTASWSWDTSNRDAQYWLQQPDGTYKKADAYTQIGLNTDNLSAKDIDGYSKHTGIPSGYPRSGRYDDNNQSTGTYGKYTYRFYYDRAQYKIDYYFGSTNLRTINNVYFEADISGNTYNYIPAKPDNTSTIDYSDYTWGGWYAEAALQNPYTFDKMPGHNLALYAKWIAPTFTVDFEMNGGTPVAESQTLSKYERAEKPENPTKTGYTFEGWFTSADGTTLFDWNTQITSDTTVYAHWTKDTLSYTVHYIDEDGNPVADDKVVTNPNFTVGQSITEQAIAVAGYRPQTNSQTIELADSGNEITFIYSAKAETTSYKVRYVIADGETGAGTAVAAEKTVEAVPGDTASIIEMAAAVNYTDLYAAHPELNGIEFFPDEVEKSFVLTASAEANVFYFYYSSYKNAKVTVNFVDMNGTPIPNMAQDVQILKVGKTFTLSRTPIAGWELNKAVEGTSYSGTEAGNSYKITNDVTENGLTFTLYYQRKATVTAKSASKQYDGTALTLPESLDGQITVEGLLPGDIPQNVSLTYANADSEDGKGRINSGIATVTPNSLTIGGTHTNSNYYKIRYISGTLEVTKINVTVRIEPDRWTGAPYTGEDYKTGFTNPNKGIADYVMISNEDYANEYLDDIWAAIIGLDNVKEGGAGLGYYVESQKDVGDYTYNLGLAEGVLPTGNDNYSVSLYVRQGRLQIIPADLTITAKPQTYTYNGSEQGPKGTYTAGIDSYVTVEGLKGSDTLTSITLSGLKTDAGIYNEEIEPKDALIGNEGSLNNNYNISYVNNTLTINPIEVTLTAVSDSKTYNGAEQSISGYTSSVDGLEFEGVSATGLGTNAGEYDVTFTGVTEGETTDTTGNYVVSNIETGKLTIDPKPVTVTAQDKEFAYTGEAQSWPEYDVEGLVGNDAITAVVEGSITFPSESPVTNVVKSHTFTTGNPDNYNVSYENGKLTMTNASVAITITAASQAWTYDGSAHTNNSVTVTSGQLLSGDKLVATATGSVTNVADTAEGNNPVAAGYKIMHGDEDVTANYVITPVAGKLTINPKAVTVTAKSEEFTYDGTAHSNTGYDVDGLVGEDKISAVVEGSITFPSQSPVANVVKSHEFTEGTAGNYTVSYVDGELTMKKASVPITITAADDEWTYDGSAHTNNTVTVTEGTLLTGDKLVATATGSVTNVADTAAGNNPVAEGYKIMHGTEDVTANYVITPVAGTLTINPKAVTVTAQDKAFTYTGNAQSWPEYNVEGLVGDDAISAVVSGSITFPSQSPVTNKVESYEFTAGTPGNYTVTPVDGKLTMTNASVEITITAASQAWTYDGSAHTNNSVTVTSGQLLSGDKLVATATGSVTNVADTAAGNNPVAEGYKIMHGDEDVTANYAITPVAGTLTINPKAVTVTAKSEGFTYDGTAHSNAGYDVEGLVEGDDISAVVTGSITFPSQSPVTNKVESYEFTKGTAGNYTVTPVDGKLTMTKAEVAITITAASDEKIYDGTPLTNNTVTVTSGQLLDGDTLVATAEGSVTYVAETAEGNNPIAEGYKIMHGTEDVTANYVITPVAGTLTIKQKPITITAASDEKVYDGTPLTNDTYKYEETALGLGDRIESVTVTGSQTVVGTSNNVPSAAVIKNLGNDVTSNYDITYAKGTLTVTPKTLTITADSGNKVYDGTALTKNSYTNTELGTGDSIASVTVTGSQTVVGSSANVASEAKIVNAAGDDVTESYTISYQPGTLTVTPKAITVTADSGNKVYDGTALTKNSYTNTELGTGDSIASVTVTGSQTVVGSSANVASEAKIVNAKGEDVTSSYTISYVDGTLKVTQKTLTITADSDNKVYDGTALTKNTYTNTALAEGDSIESVTVTGSQTVVGKSDNIPSAAKIVNADGADVTTSYNITYANGTLEVTKKAVTITADSDTKVYDGTALTKNTYTNTELAVGDKVESVTVTGSQTVVGSSDNVPSTAKIVNANNEDVTTSYAITYANGTLEVTPKDLTITADSATKVYDGTALTKSTYTNTALAEGDKIDSVTVTGSQTVVGKSDNVVSAAKIVNAAGTDVTASYNIKYTNGELEVTQKAVTITADSDTKVYDGSALTKNSYTNTALATGDSIESVTVTGSQTVVGSSNNVPSAAKIVNAEGEDVTASYAITYTNGTLEVTKKTVTITADSDTKVYDGTALTKGTYTNTALATGDSIESVTVTGSQTVVGSSNNVPSAAKIVNAAGEDVTTSYDITYANGTLEVTKKAVTITADSATKVYDGKALTKDSYKNTDLAAGDSIDSVTVTGSQTKVGSSPNVPSEAVIKNAAGEDVTASYEITYANGTLEVTKNQAVLITADSDTKVYDGTALTKNSYQVSGLADGDKVDSVTITGSQTVAGTSANVPSEAKIVNAAGEDVTDSYDVTYRNGTLEVTKKTVTITADSDIKVYDGIPLTKDSYTNTDLAEDDSIESVTVTGSQTTVGSSNNVPSAAKITNKAGDDVTESYDITYANGTLEVTKKAVTITAGSDTKVYDGTPLTKNSYTNTDLAAGDVIQALSVTVTGSQTVAGSSANVPSEGKIVNAAGVDVTASYEITYANGTLTVTPKAVTITADSDTKVYDGTALTKNSATPDGLAAGDKIGSVTLTGSQTVVGTSDNVASEAKIVNTAGEDVTASYTITYAKGTLEVTKKAITITADSDTKVYDGEPLTKDSYTSDKLAEGDTFDSVTVTGSQTTVGSSDNVPSAAKIVNAAGEDVTASYDITYKNGTLEVTEMTVTITAGSATKTYDGTALTNDSFTNTKLAEGDKVESVTVTGSQTVVGKSDNVPSAAKIVNADGVDVTASYTIKYANGTLEVTPKTLTVTADSDSKVYDGTALTKNSYTSSGLASGDKFDSVTVTGSQTVVGTSDNVASTAKIVNAAGEDVTASYTITYAKGSLEVTPKALAITADSDTKVYDGAALTKDSYTNSALAEGDTIESVTVTGSQTVVGKSDNVPSAAKITNKAGEDVTASYTITYAKGSLEVTPKALAITADSDTKIYDGTALTKDSYTNTTLAEGDTIESVVVTGSQTVVGKSDNVPSAAVIKNAAGTNVTDSYDITYINGSLEVTKKAVTITADSDTKVYDGTALTKSTYTNTELAAGDKVDSVTVTGSQTVVGKSDNVPSAAKIVNAAGEDVTASYEISYANGSLEVTKKAVTITADSDTKVYDGTALTKNSYTNTDLAEGDEIGSVKITGSQTVVGSSANVASEAKIVNADGEDVTASYAITYVDGLLKVTKNSAVIITADSDTKVYDGTALTKNSYKVSGLAEGDKVESATVTGSQTVVGKSDNVPSGAKIVNAAGEDVTDSYDITYANGTLEVTKKAVTITADSDTKIYDGSALTKDSYTNTDLAAGDKIDSVKVTGSQTVVGKSDNTPSEAVIKNAAGEDVTASYEITYAKGSLEVTPKAVTVTADSADKVYDGTALTKDSYTNTDLAAGDKIDSVKVTGSQTVVGRSDNTPSEAVIKNAAGEDVAASYDITYVKGALEVTPKALTITADSDSKVYDGTALTKDSYTNTDLAAGDKIDSVTVTGSQTTVGTSDNVPSEAKIVNAAGEDVTASYTITYAKGTLEVTQKEITITADSDTKIYDGEPLTKNSYTNTDLAEGDKIESVKVTGSQTVVGKSDNVASDAKIVNAAGEEVTASYKITYVKGTLEVTEKEVTITAESDSKVYDGTALTKNSYKNTALADGDRVESVTVTGSQTVVGTSDNVPSEAKIVNAAGEDVTASYKVKYVNGELEVTPKKITITADSDSKVYDGTALTKDSYTNTDLASGDSFESVTVTGSQTTVGTSDNVPSEAKIVNAAGEDVTASYDIEYVNGTLTVTQKEITITADSDSKVYDGAALTKDSYTNTALAAGDQIDSVTVTGSQTVVGKSDNVPSEAVIKNAAGEDVTASYKITYANGELEVTPKAITITADDAEKVYDGTALTKDSYTNTALAEGDEIESVKVTGSQTIVGESDNVPSAAVIRNAAGEDVTASYEITYANGTLTVTPKAITITADSDTKIYDGTALTKDSYTNTELGRGDKIESVKVTGSQTVVGKSDNVASDAKIVDADGEDVTESYDITYVKGSLEVTKKAVTITADSDTKIYDGTALTKDSYTNTDLAEGDEIESVKVTGSQTVVGKSDNVPSAAKIVNADGEDVTESYEITYANGSLEVTKKAVTITADSDTKVYDGKPLTKDSYTNTALAEGDEIESVTVTGSQTKVGEADNVPSDAKIVNKDGEDVTESYDITYINGLLKVTKNDALIITADSDTKVYDGKPLTKDSYKVAGLADGDSVESVKISGSQTAAGESPNMPSEAVIINADGEEVTDSYEITYVDGKLEVTQKDLTITADSDTKVYDGKALTKNSYINTALADGDEIESVTVTGSQTVVGKSDNTPSAAVIKNADGTDVTESYNITYIKGELEVTKKALTITADSDTKTYDGAALTKDSYTNGALAEGDEITSVTVTGSQTVVGKSDNTPSEAKIANAAGEDVTSSYDITYVKGTLEVTPKKLTITADSDSKVYDGTALTKNSYTNTDLASGDSFESVTVTGSQINVGKSDNVPSAAVIKNADGDVVTSSYDITYVNGELEVTRKEVTVKADDQSKIYGEADPELTAKVTGLVSEDDTIEYDVTRTSGEAVGEYPITPSGEEEQGNYLVRYEEGTLTITKAEIPDDPDDPEDPKDGRFQATVPEDVVYNGKEQKQPITVTDTKTGNVLTENDITITYSRDVTNVGEVTVTITANEDGNYSGSFTRTYNITPAPLTVTTGSDEKVYDGEALTKDEASIDGLQNNEIATIHATGSQTDVGSSDNTYEITWDGTADKNNYEIVKEDLGTLTVTKATIPDNPDDPDDPKGGRFQATVPEDVVYNGREQQQPITITDTVSGKVLTEDDVTITYSEDATNVGTVTVTITAKEDSNYEGTFTRTYRITPAPVTIKTGSDEKVYDGTPLTNGDVTIEGLVNGETATAVTTGSQINAGSSDNTYDLTWGTAKASNYKVTDDLGTLTVRKATIPEESDDRFDVSTPENVVYNGKEQKQPVTITDKVTGRTLVEGEDFTITYSPAVNAGRVLVTIEGIGNYDGTLTRTYEITKAPITIITNSDRKQYDGTALTAGGKITGLVNGETVTFRVTGRRVNVGTSDNTYSLKWDKTALEDNYEIVYERIGKLTVTQAPTPDDGNPNPGPNPGPAPGPAPTVVINPPAPVIDDAPAPEAAPETVEPEQAPAAVNEGFWALINLICTIASVLLSLFILIRYLGKSKKDADDDEKNAEAAQTENADADEKKQQQIKKKGLLRIMDIIPAVAAVITFILTEDMTQQMQLVDQWTLLMVVILLIDVVLAVFTKRTTKDIEDDDEQEQNTQA